MGSGGPLLVKNGIIYRFLRYITLLSSIANVICMQMKGNYLKLMLNSKLLTNKPRKNMNMINFHMKTKAYSLYISIF
jgi:hypothetical protein